MPFIYQSGSGGSTGGSPGGSVMLPSFNINEDMELIASSVDTSLFNFALNNDLELEVTTYGNN